MPRRPRQDPGLLLKDASVIRGVCRRVFNSPLLASDEERAYVVSQITSISDLLEKRALQAHRKMQEEGTAVGTSLVISPVEHVEVEEGE